MNRLIILGNGDALEQALASWSAARPELDCVRVDLSYGADFAWDLDVMKPYAPADAPVFLAMGSEALNMARLKVMIDLKQLGYRLETFISPQAAVAPNAVIGESCFIAEGAVIGPLASVKFNCVVGPRSIIGIGCKLGNSVWLGTGVNLGARAQIGNNTTVGSGVFVHPERKIGSQCEITRPIEVTADIPSRSFYSPMFEDVARVYGAA